MIISVDEEQAFHKIQNPFMMETLHKLGIEGKFLSLINGIYKNPQQASHLTPSLSVQEQDKDVCSCHFYSTLHWRFQP